MTTRRIPAGGPYLETLRYVAPPSAVATVPPRTAKAATPPNDRPEETPQATTPTETGGDHSTRWALAAARHTNKGHTIAGPAGDDAHEAPEHGAVAPVARLQQLRSSSESGTTCNGIRGK
eukprot:gene9734-8557_t